MARLVIFALLLALPLACTQGQGQGTQGQNQGRGDGSWRFDNITSKEQAIQRMQGGLSVMAASDFASDSTTTRNGNKLKAMFDDWARTFDYSFRGQEYARAFRNFRDNMAQVQRVNSDPSVPFWASGNAFSHLSTDEFAQQYLMSLPASSSGTITDDPATATFNPGSRKLVQTPPANVNWVTAGKVTPIRNQGACGSCWAFAATSAIESAYLRLVGGSASTLNLSEQQMVSCVTDSYGCSGGYSDRAMNYVASVNQTTEARYPYRATTGTCSSTIIKSSTSGLAVKLTGTSARVYPNSPTTLKAAVAVTPTVVYFAVDRSFQSYAGGVYTATTCSNGINHAMVAVGYQTTGTTTPYWIIRNSWGTGWGAQGYARVVMKGAGAGPCGMYQYAYMPPSRFVSTPLRA